MEETKSFRWDVSSRSARDWEGAIGREDKGFLQDGASGLAGVGKGQEVPLEWNFKSRSLLRLE